MSEMNTIGPMVLGLPLEVFLMFASGVFYAICAIFVWRPLRQEKNELIGALFAFLVYQAVAMVFMGLGMHYMNMIYNNIASLAIFIGSVYMLKFPFSSFSQAMRRILFIASLIIVLVVYAWFLLTPMRQMELENFIVWYDIIVNGVFVGLFMIYIGFRTSESALRIKALGGGSGVTSCCVVSNVAMLSGAVIVGSTFQFLAPILILSSIAIGRRRQKNLQDPMARAM